MCQWIFLTPPILVTKGVFTRQSKNVTDPTKTGTVFAKKQ